MRRYGQVALARAELPGEAGQEEIETPRFMDYHDHLKLPPEAIEQIAQGRFEIAVITGAVCPT
jgi:hypothetical protein